MVAFPKRALLESATMNIRFATPFVALALLGLSACGGSSSSSDNTAPADADVVVRAIEGIAWNQKEFTASAADGPVVIYGVNDSSIAHNLYVLDASDAVIGDFIDLPKRGADGSRQLDLAAGEYRIVCKIPGHNNMSSTLIVS
jgi:plastocyanin